MSGNTGTVTLTFKVDEKGAVTDVKRLGTEFDKTGRKGEDAFRKSGRTLGDMNDRMERSNGLMTKMHGLVGALAGVYGLKKLADAFMDVTRAASDLEEVTSKFATVFGTQTALADAWARNLVLNYAMSTREARQYLAAMQDLLEPMGMNATAAARMSNEVVKLSADLGSFNNLETAQVMGDIQSALVGNYETMKKYGVVLNATTVQERALAMGLARTKENLTAANKAQAAYTMIVEGSKNAVGDMARTSGSYANQVKQMQAQMEDFKAMLGQEFLPILTSALEKMNTLMRETFHFGESRVEELARLREELKLDLAKFESVKQAGGMTDAALGWLPGYITQEEATYAMAIIEMRIAMISEEIERQKAIIETDGRPDTPPPPLPTEEAMEIGLAEYEHFVEAIMKLRERALARDTGYDMGDRDAIMSNLFGGHDAALAVQQAQDELEREFETEVPKAAKAGTDTIARDYEHMLDNIHDETKSVFRRIFDGTIDGWRGMCDVLKGYMFDLFAELAAQAVARPIVVPIVTALAGGLGFPGLASAAGGGTDVAGFAGLGSAIHGVSSFPVASLLPAGMWGGTAGAGLSGEAIAAGTDAATAAAGATSLGAILGAAGLGALGYSTIGGMVGLPQSKYSGWTAGAGAGLGFMVGGPIGAAVGALGGGVLGGLLGGGTDYITGSMGVKGNLVTGEYGGYGAGAGEYEAAFGPYIQETAAQIQALLAREILDVSDLDAIAAISTGRSGMKVDPEVWDATIPAGEDLASLRGRVADFFAELLPDVLDEWARSEYPDIATDDFKSRVSDVLAEGGLEGVNAYLEAFTGMVEGLNATIEGAGLSDVQVQIRQVTAYYREQAVAAHELGVSLDLVGEALRTQLDAVTSARITSATTLAELAAASDVFAAEHKEYTAGLGDVDALTAAAVAKQATTDDLKAARDAAEEQKQAAYDTWQGSKWVQDPWYAYLEHEWMTVYGYPPPQSPKNQYNTASAGAASAEADYQAAFGESEAAWAAAGTASDDTSALLETFQASREKYRAQLERIKAGGDAADLEVALSQIDDTLELFAGLTDSIPTISADIALLEDVRDMLIEDFMSPLTDIIDRGSMSEWNYELAQLNDWYETQADTIAYLFDAGTQAYLDAMATLNNAAEYQGQDLIDRYITPVTESIREFMTEMLLSDLSPVQSAEAATSQYNSLLADARANPEDVSGLLSYVPEFLDYMRAYGGDYNALWDTVMADLSGIETSLASTTVQVGDSATGPLSLPGATVDAQAVGAAVAQSIAPLVSEEREIHITIVMDGKEVASVVANQYKAGHAELIEQTRRRVS